MGIRKLLLTIFISLFTGVIFSGCSSLAPSGGSAQTSDTLNPPNPNAAGPADPYEPSSNQLVNPDFTPGGNVLPLVVPGTTSSANPSPSGQPTQTGQGCDDCVPAFILQLKLPASDANTYANREIVDQTMEVEFQTASDPSATWSPFQTFSDPDNSLIKMLYNDSFTVVFASKDMKELCENPDANAKRFLRFSISYYVKSRDKYGSPSDPSYYDSFKSLPDPNATYNCSSGTPPLLTLTLYRPATDEVITHGVP